MKVEDLQKSFPEGIRMPTLLAHLCEYTEQMGMGRVVSSDLVLTSEGKDRLEGWFRGNLEASTRFICFIRDGVDGLYGYWFEDAANRSLDHAPLVYLSDENVENTVLANTLEEFLALIAIGQPRLGRFDEWDEDELVDDDTRRYQDWLRSELGIAPPTFTDALRIIERARGAHPDLDQWLRQ